MLSDNSREIDAAAPDSADVELLVCSTCRRAEGTAEADADAPRPGALLHAGLERTELPAGIQVRSVQCLSNCSQGCTIALRSPGRWTYVYGNIDPDTQLDTVVDGVTRYAATADGLVPWRERPQHFKKNCIARIPPIEVAS